MAAPIGGACSSAQGADSGWDGGGGGGGGVPIAPAAPTNDKTGAGEQGETKRESTMLLLRRGDDDAGGEEGEGVEDTEVVEALSAKRRRTLLSGVQRWCLDVSEWDELSADQVRCRW